MLRVLICVAVLALGACQLVQPGKSVAPDQVSPITGDTISVTSLDAPGTPETAPAPAAQTDATAAPAEPARLDAVAEPAATPKPDIAPSPEAVVTIKTAAHLACEKRGGRWSMAGSAKASFCQTATRDAGKICTKASDCAGYCLAKSGTCAPYTPLLGCHDILNDAGRMLTECIN